MKEIHQMEALPQTFQEQVSRIQIWNSLWAGHFDVSLMSKNHFEVSKTARAR